MKNLFLIVFVCLSSVFIAQATDLRRDNDYSACKGIQPEKRESGKVKWFDERKGMGVITPDNGGFDIIVLAADVKQAGLISLTAGQYILYQTFKEKKRTIAINLKLPI